jgi:hypothetical protein
MNRWRDIGRGSAALLAFAGAGHAAAETPSLTWRNVRQVVVHCNVQDERTGFDEARTRQLCNQVRALAATGAPVPLRVAGFGDPALNAADSVTLAVQATTRGSAGDKTLLFTIRAHRASDDQAAELFGSTLRTAPLAAAAPAIEQALAEVLPWKAQPLGARPIR